VKLPDGRVIGTRAVYARLRVDGQEPAVVDGRERPAHPEGVCLRFRVQPERERGCACVSVRESERESSLRCILNASGVFECQGLVREREIARVDPATRSTTDRS
jgi:hypothetical protein